MNSTTYIFRFGLWLCPLIGFAQQSGVGQWRDHYSYNNVSTIVVLKNEICGVTENGLFYYNNKENSIRRKTTIQGLSEVGLTASNYEPSTQTQIIGYASGNIDLIQNGRVFNIPDLQRKPMSGSKRINKIVVENSQKVYLCGDFGILVLNLLKREISEEYFINSNVQVNDLAIGDSVIYAATNAGLLSADRFSKRLADASVWREVPVNSQHGQPFQSVCLWNRNLILQSSLNLNDTNLRNDTIWRYFQNEWHVLDTMFSKQIKVSRNRLFQLRKIPDVEWLFEIREYGSDFQVLNEYGNKAQDADLWTLEDIEADSENNVWFSTGYGGLTRLAPNWTYGGSVLPQGPTTNSVYALSHSSSTLYSSRGSMNAGYWTPRMLDFEVNMFQNNNWKVFNNQTIRPSRWLADALAVAEDPRNPDVFVVASWHSGVVQHNADGSTTLYDDENSSLEWILWEGIKSSIRCGDVHFDRKNQLWVTNTGQNVVHQLHKRDASGKWTPYDLGHVISTDPKEFIVDYHNQLWIRTRWDTRSRYNLVFFRETSNGGFDALIANLNRGNEQQASVLNCLVEDHKGFVWLGTDRGILVNRKSLELFDKPNDSESTVEFTTIIYEGRPLFENEFVTAIAVDGADRKWVGTSSSGVFLMSADGREMIHQFNTENSPLNSNAITALAINPKTGEVFIGTDKGLMSYGGNATAASRTEQKMVIFPNPVRADFTGEIGIRGLAENAKVHITDASGVVVFETTANGGMATWNGKNRNGQRVKPGVYVVFSVVVDEYDGVLAKGVGKIFISK